MDLFWLPLGAGGHSVRLNGRLCEGLAAFRQHRRARDLYHSALQVSVPKGRFVIEMTPVRRPNPRREIIANGAVGAAWAASWKIGRYEVCRWRDGTIPDVAEAVDSPRHMTADASTQTGYSSSSPHCRPQCGVATSWRRERCGTPTR